jgi:hypothetical protein
MVRCHIARSVSLGCRSTDIKPYPVSSSSTITPNGPSPPHDPPINQRAQDQPELEEDDRVDAEVEHRLQMPVEVAAGTSSSKETRIKETKIGWSRQHSFGRPSIG